MKTRRVARAGTVAVLVSALVTSGCSPFGGASEIPIADKAWKASYVLGDNPAVYEAGKLVLVRTESALTALSAETGEERWSVSDLVGDVHVTEDLAVIRTDGYRNVSAVDLKTGEERVLVEADGEETFDNVAVAGDTLFTHERVPDAHPWTVQLTARELSSGDELWHKDFDDSLGDDFGRHLAVHAPVALNQPFAVDSDEPRDIVAVAPNAPLLYASNDSWDGTATVTVAVDVKTGDIVEKLPEPLLDLEYLNALITDDGALVTERFMDEKGKCQYIVDFTDGDDAHSVVFRANSLIDLDECAESDRAPWIAGKHMCGADAKSRPQLVDLATGEVIWRETEVPGDVFGCVGRVVIRFREGINEGFIAGVDSQSGETLWERDAGEDEGRFARVVHDGQLIDAGRTNVVAVDPATGDRIWKVCETRGAPCHLVGVGPGRVYVDSSGSLVAVDTER